MIVNVKELRKVKVEYEPNPEPPDDGGEGGGGGDFPMPPEDKPWDEENDGGEGSGGGEGVKSQGPPKPVLTSGMPTNMEELKEDWKKEIEKAKNRNAGNMPGNLMRILDILLASKVDWRQNLRKFAQSLSSRSEYFLPNKRFLAGGNILWGAKKQKTTFETLTIIADTSASVSQKELEQFVSEAIDIMKIYNPKETYLIWCDTTVYEPVDVIKRGEKWNYRKAPGGGGTSFHPPFAWIEKNILGKKKMGPVIFFTDGEPNTGPHGGWPQLNEYGIKAYQSKVIWVILGERGMPRDHVQIPFGKRIDLL